MEDRRLNNSNKRPSSSTKIATTSSRNSNTYAASTTTRRPHSSPSLVSSASAFAVSSGPGSTSIRSGSRRSSAATATTKGGGATAKAEATASTNIALLEKEVRRQLLLQPQQPHHRATTTKKPCTTTRRPHSSSAIINKSAAAVQTNNAKATTTSIAANKAVAAKKKTMIVAKDSSSYSSTDVAEEDPSSSSSSSSNDKITPTTTSDSSDKDEQEKDQKQLLIDALGIGSYHLPGNNWWQDWFAYFGNNHPLFSLCFSNRLHPISKWMRLVGFLGSVIFGLAITNLVWLLFVYGNDNANEVYFSMSSSGFQIKNGTHYTYLQEDGVTKLVLETVTGVEVSTGMIILWTLGGAIHAIYDNLIWYASTCSCCGDIGKKYQRLGSILVMVSVVLVAIASTITIIIRVNLDNQETKQDMILKSGMDLKAIQIDLSQITDKSNYEFLMAYAIELAVAWFVHYPIQETILFSGCLGCWWCGLRRGFTGVTPNSLPAPLASFLGGRPYEMYQEKMTAQDNADDDVDIVIDAKSTHSSNGSSGQNNKSIKHHHRQSNNDEDVERGSSF